jgi:hypothetical protein
VRSTPRTIARLPSTWTAAAQVELAREPAASALGSGATKTTRFERWCINAIENIE